MTADLRAIQSWKTWRYADTEDSIALALQGDSAGDAGAQGSSFVIGVAPYTALALRSFGSDAENETATMEIYGFMVPDTKHGSGPGQSLWRGQLTLGSFASTGATGRPCNDGKWPAAATKEVKSYDSSVTNGYNTNKAVALTGDNRAMLIFPTLGYTHLYMNITDMAGGAEMSTLGVLFREIAMGAVV